MYQDYLDVLPEIQDALNAGKPVVALESTIISHGMPYPENEKFANDVEGIIRAEGAVPATIAVINGRLKVGLTPDDLSLMASGKNIAKVSRRDLPYLVAMKQTGATTVTTTMMIAAMAGIRVFATGAGDSFTAAMVYGWLCELGPEASLDLAMKAAEITIMETLTVTPKIRSLTNH